MRPKYVGVRRKFMAEGEKDRAALRKTRKESVQMRAAGAWDIVYDAVNNFSLNGDANQAAAVALQQGHAQVPLQGLQLQGDGRLADEKRVRGPRNRAQAHCLAERPQRLEPVRFVGKTRTCVWRHRMVVPAY